MTDLKLLSQKEICSLFEWSKSSLYRSELFEKRLIIGKNCVRWRYIDAIEFLEKCNSNGLPDNKLGRKNNANS
tara:strand:+ start:282 stop:500 length:219 start_codon:yes stop_codon:yes gene_type:complete